MKLEISKDERNLIVRALYGLPHVLAAPALRPLPHPPEVVSLCDRLMELRDDANPLPVPLESDGPQGANVPSAVPRQAELLPGGISGRVQGGDEPKRTAQTEAGR
jgi:hypothetical protein